MLLPLDVLIPLSVLKDLEFLDDFSHSDDLLGSERTSASQDPIGRPLSPLVLAAVVRFSPSS